MPFNGFDADLVQFLKELDKNNDREWFTANKARFEDSVQGPLLEFIEALAPRLEKISPHVVADPRKVGGSLMRIYRDTRFSNDKSPYKTFMAAQFRHAQGKDIHAPGFYIQININETLLGTGIWQPPTDVVGKIRAAIDANPKAWLKARDDKKFVSLYGPLAGESLKRPPAGYDKEHPLVEDLKRKDFAAFRTLKPKDILKKDFVAEAEKTYAASKPLMQFLHDALELPF